VLRERERRGGFSDLDQLESVPGFPRDYLDDLKRRLSL
jgi:DNA uptake protein ComE-like DNA-binding protein